MKDRWNSWKGPLAALPVAGVIAAVVVLLVFYASPSPAAAATPCSGVPITPRDNLAAIVNADSKTEATMFCVQAGTYTISQPLILRNGDKLIGQPGGGTQRGPAFDPDPVVKVVAGSGVGSVVRGIGSNILVEWIDISGARAASGCTGSGVGIGAGSTDGTFVAQYNYIHDNDSVGIGNAHGSILNNEFTKNTLKSTCVGKNGSGVKGLTEYQAAYNYVHDEQGNGLWCNSGCPDDPTFPGGLNGFWAHHNLVVNNARGGIRIENSPNGAVIEYNEIHGNSSKAVRGGVSIRDSQNVLVQFNVFGQATIAGITYPPNANNVAIRASDSGRANRTDLRNVRIEHNALNGEAIKGCELPDNVVLCVF